MKNRRNRKAAIAKAGVALAATTLIPDTADAQRLVTMPAISIARFQTAQIHLGSPPEPVSDPPEPVRPPCEATLGFIDANGQPFVDAAGRPMERTVSVEPGQTASFSLPTSVVFGDGRGLRALFRATARLGTPPDPIRPESCANAQVSVEIYDNLTGRTTIALADPPDPVKPQQREE
jgi:hypothetical protein